MTSLDIVSRISRHLFLLVFRGNVCSFFFKKKTTYVNLYPFPPNKLIIYMSLYIITIIFCVRQSLKDHIFYLPRKVLQMYSEIWLPDLDDSEKCDSSLFSILLNCNKKKMEADH